MWMRTYTFLPQKGERSERAPCRRGQGQRQLKGNYKIKMASYHLSARVGKKGKAGPHAEYIAREGKYADEPKYEWEMSFVKITLQL